MDGSLAGDAMDVDKEEVDRPAISEADWRISVQLRSRRTAALTQSESVFENSSCILDTLTYM